MLPFLFYVGIFSEISIIPHCSSGCSKCPHFPVNDQNSFLWPAMSLGGALLCSLQKLLFQGFRKEPASVCLLPQYWVLSAAPLSSDWYHIHNLSHLISHPVMSLLPSHLSSNQQLSDVFALSLTVAFWDNALGISVVVCIFAIWCWGCVCFSFPVLRSPILFSHMPSSLCSCSLLASRLLFFSCVFKVLHLPRVLLIISILFIIHWSSSLLNPFRKGAEGSVIIKQGSDFCFPKSVSKSICAPKAPLPLDLWHCGHIDTVSTNADRLEKEDMLVVDFFPCWKYILSPLTRLTWAKLCFPGTVVSIFILGFASRTISVWLCGSFIHTVWGRCCESQAL